MLSCRVTRRVSFIGSLQLGQRRSMAKLRFNSSCQGRQRERWVGRLGRRRRAGG
jgi:hypothetical protein